VRELYPENEVVIVEKRKLRESPFREQVRILRQLRGRAVVFCFRSLTDVTAPLLLQWIGFFHRCHVTIWLDDAGNRKVHQRWSWLYLVPITLFAVASDVWVFLISFVRLKSDLLRPMTRPGSSVKTAEGILAYLFSYPLLRFCVGGAMSHVR